MHRSVGSAYGGALPAQDVAARIMLAYPRRAAVQEKRFPHAVRLFRQAQGADFDRQAPLLHADGLLPGVQRAGLHQLFRQVGGLFRRHVVYIGAQLRQQFRGTLLFLRFHQHHPEDIRQGEPLAVADAVAGSGDAARQRGRDRPRQGGNISCSGGSGGLMGGSVQGGLEAARQQGCGRGRNGHRSVLAGHGA